MILSIHTIVKISIATILIQGIINSSNAFSITGPTPISKPWLSLTKQRTTTNSNRLSSTSTQSQSQKPPRSSFSLFRPSSTNIHSSLDAASSSSTSSRSMEINPDAKPSDEWELDCYSRPVMVGGKKLWEVLITDSTGSFRLCETLPSNKWVKD